MYKIFKSFLIVLALLVTAGISNKAHAFTITQNSEAKWGVGFYLFATTRDTNETYRLVFNPQNGIVRFGNLNGGVFDNVSFEAAVMNTVEVQKYNTASQTYQNVAGNLSGSLNFNYSNVSFDAGTNQIAALNGIASSPTPSLTFNASGTLEGQNIQFVQNTPLNAGFMDIMEGKFNGIWDSIIHSFGQNGVADFAMSIKTDSFIDAWVYNASTTVDFGGTGRQFSLSGDIHSSISEIPEPATVGLLFSGLVGAAASRRKRKKMDA